MSCLQTPNHTNLAQKYGTFPLEIPRVQFSDVDGLQLVLQHFQLRSTLGQACRDLPIPKPGPLPFRIQNLKTSKARPCVALW